ncbi:MAG: PEGA domain-containing protein [Myxococcales bacterium]|nr:PEGA domain-containing protein [Myxococcales bacterium]
MDATKGTIVTASARAGHRIYVDEKVVGQTPDAVTVRCGTRSVRLGSAGTKRQVDVPCGGEIAVEH